MEVLAGPVAIPRPVNTKRATRLNDERIVLWKH